MFCWSYFAVVHRSLHFANPTKGKICPEHIIKWRKTASRDHTKIQVRGSCENQKGHPKESGMPVSFEVVAIIAYIALDRAAFYGFGLAAMQYLLTMFEMSPQSANLFFSIYYMLVNYLGVFGSYLSDARFGKWNVTISTGLIYIVGPRAGLRLLSSVCLEELSVFHRNHPLDLLLCRSSTGRTCKILQNGVHRLVG